MLLAIDVGNSNTVLGLYQAAPATAGDAQRRFLPELLIHWRITTSQPRTTDELGVLLHSLFQSGGYKMASVTGIAISSVVPPMNHILRKVCELYFKLHPFFVEPGHKTTIPLLTDNPTETGADRIVNCVAAFERFNGPAIVVDMGTATTFDVVSPQGEFLGGAIAPGLGISSDALFSRIPRLPRILVSKPAKIIGTGTIDNMQIGLYYGYIGLVDGILERMLAELTAQYGAGVRIRTIATGGLAGLISTGSRYIEEVDPNLTLTGLRLVFERASAHQEETQDRRRPA
jgi:type III pantothenate kinase